MAEASTVEGREQREMKYWVTHTIIIDGVRAKIQAHVPMVSRPFFAHRDPDCTRFFSYLHFGGSMHDVLSVMVFTREKDLRFTHFKATLIEGKECLTTGRRKVAENWCTKRFAVPRFGEAYFGGCRQCFKFRESSPDSWSIVVEFEFKKISADPSSLEQSDVRRLSECRFKDAFRQLLDSEENADVTFLVGSQKIVAHKLVLTTRCDYFKALFDSGMMESASNEVAVPDIRPEIFKKLLEFLYCDYCPPFQPNVSLELLSAAEKYGLEDLKKLVEITICKNLNSEIVVEALQLAESHNCQYLMECAMSEFRSCGGTLSIEKWRQLEETPKLLRKLLQCYCEQ